MKNNLLIFAEFDSSGGTREFLKQLIVINYELNYKSHVVCEKVDKLLLSFFHKYNVEFTIVKKRSIFYSKPFLSFFFEFYYHYPIILKLKPDIIISSVGTPGINFFHFCLCKKFIYILHTIPSKQGVKSRLHYSLPYIFQSKKKVFFVVSNFLKEKLNLLWKIDKKYIRVIYNSYRFRENLQNRIKSHKEGLTILSIGHLTEYKNPNLWLETAIQLTSKYDFLTFIWVGDGPLMNELIKKTPKNLKIHFIGNSNDVEPFYKNCDLYLNLSITESLGMGVVDAISFGIPCIVRNVGGLPEIIKHSFNGYTFDNSESLIKYIEKLIFDKKIRQEMSNYSFQLVKNVFSKENQLIQVKNLYENI